MRMSEKQFNDMVQKNNIKVKKVTEKKTNKYLNTKIYVYENNVASETKLPDKKPVMVFDSKKEYNRWCELRLMEKAGEISELSRQKVLVIIEDFMYDGSKIKGINYKADFYYKKKDGNIYVEDVKPFDKKTEVYRTTKDFNLKWKLLKNKYPEYKFVLF